MGGQICQFSANSADNSRATQFPLFFLASKKKQKKSRDDQFPITVKPGSVTVLINRIRKKTGYIYYQVRYYIDGVRQAKTLADLAEANKQATVAGAKSPLCAALLNKAVNVRLLARSRPSDVCCGRAALERGDFSRFLSL